MKLYHATPKSNEDRIIKEGLRIGQGTMWEDMTNRDKLYFAFSPSTAIDFVETSDYFIGDYGDIVVFEVDTSDMDMNCMDYDYNILCECPEDVISVTYDKCVPSEFLKAYSQEEAESLDDVEFDDLKHIDEDSRYIWENIKTCLMKK